MKRMCNVLEGRSGLFVVFAAHALIACGNSVSPGPMDDASADTGSLVYADDASATHDGATLGDAALGSDAPAESTSADGGTIVGATPDASTDAATADATGFGRVLVDEYVNDPNTSTRDLTVAGFYFAPATTSAITQTRVGPCTVTHIPLSVNSDSAGVLSLTLGTSSPVRIGYAGSIYDVESQTVLSPGDNVTVTATGDVAPAFAVTLTAPAPLLGTDPTWTFPGPSISVPHTGFTVTWTPDASFSVDVSMVDLNQYNIECVFPGGDGTGTVPADALSVFGHGDLVGIMIASIHSTDVAGPSGTTSVGVESVAGATEGTLE